MNGEYEYTASYEPYAPDGECMVCMRLEDVCRTCFINAVEEEVHMIEWLRNVTDAGL